MRTIATGLVVGLSAAALDAAESPKTANLPLKEVILYSSGVGYFERSGEVQGNQVSELRFRTEDINDLLKSLVVQDLGGGTIGAITYDSRDPLSRTLHSFAVDLTANPSMRDLLNQVRGEAVEVFWPNPARGIIVGVEHRVLDEEKEKTREEDFLNLFTDGALTAIPLSQVKQIKLQNEKLRKELNDALAILAKGHDVEKKTVRFSFDGNGNRTVNLAYIVEAPVWKTSYRLVLDEKKEAFLQGWAIVENTGDDDWENVRLSLVSGRPISFKMDLYQPLYAARPTVEPELYLSLRPPVYQDSLAVEALQDRVAKSEVAELRAAKPMMAPAQRMTLGRGMLNEKAGFQGGTTPTSLGLATGTGAVAEGAVSGELFQYALKMPVSIQRQKSAMLPIVTEDVEVSKVSIYNQNVQVKHPLNGFRLKNTTDLHLMQGPITVFDGGSYAGDARIEDLAPGQDRLLSYAIDLKTEVEPQAKSEPETLISARIQRGTFFARKKRVEQKTYAIRNKDQKKKTVLVEHPVRADWHLDAPAEPKERARDVYRFAVEVQPGKSEKLTVEESLQYNEEVVLTSWDMNIYGFYLRAKNVSDRVKDALRKVVQFQEKIAQLVGDRKTREDRLQQIGQEQTRIRENMARLVQNSELYQRYVKKFDEQETEFEQLRAESAKLKEQEEKSRRELGDYLSGLELN